LVSNAYATLDINQDVSAKNTVIHGDTISIGGGVSNQSLNLGTGSLTSTINIGTGSGTTTINLGGAGDTVNVAGTLTTVNTTNLDVADKIIRVNKGGAASTGFSCGFEVEENSAAAGYVQTSADRNSLIIKAPNSAGIITLTPGGSGFTLDSNSITSAKKFWMNITWATNLASGTFLRPTVSTDIMSWGSTPSKTLAEVLETANKPSGSDYSGAFIAPWAGRWIISASPCPASTNIFTRPYQGTTYANMATQIGTGTIGYSNNNNISASGAWAFECATGDYIGMYIAAGGAAQAKNNIGCMNIYYVGI
jgi:hypothetical protein